MSNLFVNTKTTTKITPLAILSKEEVEEKELKLRKEITKNKSKITKLENKAKKYENKIKELEAKQWKYKVGDIVLYDGWRKAEVTGLVDFDGYLYKAKLLDTGYTATFKPEEIIAFEQSEYQERLINKIIELKTKSKVLDDK